ESSSPGEALERLHRKFDHFEPDEMATVLYLIVAPDLGHYTMASLGHLPPVVAVPGEDVSFVRHSPSPPIGARLPRPPHNVVCDLCPGMTIGCYTDGLIERRREPIDEGMERLRTAFFAGPPEEVCSQVMSDLIGMSAVQDDTALLVFRRT